MYIKISQSPFREYLIIAMLLLMLGINLLQPSIIMPIWIVAIVVAVPIVWRAIKSIVTDRTITIETFNFIAIVVSFIAVEIRSAAFIELMLTFASLLDWFTTNRARNATEELLKLKPLKAFAEKNGAISEVPIESVQVGDILVIKNGSRIPVDGMVVFGSALINESSVSGESALIEKIPGDTVLSATLNESGVIKIKATHVGKDSTIERMVALMKEAAAHKSSSEKIADKFAKIFLPVVAIMGLATYIITKNAIMTASLFLVACADDMAVAIPLAMVASIGQAAKRGVIIKGGEFLEALNNLSAIVIDKTGTLTYGHPEVQRVMIQPDVEEKKFWKLIASAEKFSEHPIGRALMHRAKQNTDELPDPDQFTPYKGSGVWARIGNNEIAIGDESILLIKKVRLDANIKDLFENEKKKFGQTTIIVCIDNKFAGLITIADIPRAEAKQSIKDLKNIGINRIVMFTGDNEVVAKRTADFLDITEVRARMKPEDKLRELKELAANGAVCMIGDGINDAPALSQANVGIAMGTGGTAVAVEAADIVVLTDDLARIPEVILLGRKTISIIRLDMAIWLVTNTVGFALVLTGVAGPALAAFYNFATDFLPLINSSRLFKKSK